MKKFKILIAIAIMLGVCNYFGHNALDFREGLSDLQIANIEALADNSEVGTSNTGPAEEKKCYGGGHRMVCRCINTNSCTGTDCY